MSIALLCPTRWRAELCGEMIDSVRSTASNLDDITIYFCLNSEDKRSIEYEYLFKSMTDIKHQIHHFPQWSLPMCFNMLGKVAKSHDLYFLIGDDCKFSDAGWDKAVSEDYQGLKNKIHMWCLQYNLDIDGTAFPVLSKEYIEASGWIVPPIFFHFFCDTWMSEIAKAANCFTYIRSHRLIHDKYHPFGARREQDDDTRRRGILDRDDYVNKKCGHFLEYEKNKMIEAMK